MYAIGTCTVEPPIKDPLERDNLSSKGTFHISKRMHVSDCVEQIHVHLSLSIWGQNGQPLLDQRHHVLYCTCTRTVYTCRLGTVCIEIELRYIQYNCSCQYIYSRTSSKQDQHSELRTSLIIRLL